MSWREQAACRGLDSDLFFPHRGDQQAAEHAKRICGGCPVSDECLAYAVDQNIRLGRWGGLTAKERRRRQPRIPDGHKRCSRCDEVKPVGAFNRNAQLKSGLHSWCIPCRRRYDNTRRRKSEYATRGVLHVS